MEPLIDKDTRDRLNDVRKELYIGGFIGFLYGGFFGGAGFYIADKYSLVTIRSAMKRKNMYAAAVLLTGCIGSYINARVRGKNASQYIGDIFKSFSNPSSAYIRRQNQSETEILSSKDEAFHRRKEQLEKRRQEKSLSKDSSSD